MGRIKKNIRSFTLIEIIIVFGLIGLILPVIFSIIFVILRQQTKIIKLQMVINEGNYIVRSIKNTIQNSAYKIYSDEDLNNEVCATSNSNYSGTLYFSNSVGKRFNYYLSGDKVASYSATINGSVDLTSDKVKITSFSTGCQRNNVFSPPIVSLNFILEYNTTSTRPEDNVSLNFYQYIKLKSY